MGGDADLDKPWFEVSIEENVVSVKFEAATVAGHRRLHRLQRREEDVVDFSEALLNCFVAVPSPQQCLDVGKEHLAPLGLVVPESGRSTHCKAFRVHTRAYVPHARKVGTTYPSAVFCTATFVK
jgi:hypothetical protein